MAISVDTVYQRVLAIANKEQRGFVTPQEFNLFANQVQMEIFEQYFYDAGQFNRMPRDETPRADVVHLLEEKISIFRRRHKPVEIGNVYGDGTLPTNVYRLDNLLTYNTNDSTRIIEEITEDELVTYGDSPLAKPTTQRPVYLRVNATQVKIYPYGDGTNGAAVYFTQSGAVLSNSTSINLTNVGDNYSSIKVGQTVIQGSIPLGATVTAINGQTLTISSAATSGGTVVLTFASGDIKCNYITKPATVNWGYTEINGTPLYNSSSSTDFELHPAEEPTIVYKILALSGISIKDQGLYQMAAQEDIKKTQQEKQ
tara:strand:+ start:34 stop:972 length:939 start_codon:yes stop_codon:yes gene_type:complete